MKTRTASLLALLVALSASALTAAPTSPANPAFGYTITTIARPQGADLTLGATPVTVLRILGARQHQLSPNVWAYTGFYPNVEAGQARGCDTLVITFTHGRVSDMKIVNRHAVGVIAANLQARHTPFQVARK